VLTSQSSADYIICEIQHKYTMTCTSCTVHSTRRQGLH